jgi:hypothetical protein
MEIVFVVDLPAASSLTGKFRLTVNAERAND